MLIVSKLVFAGGVAAVAMAGPATLGTTGQDGAQAVQVSTTAQVGPDNHTAAVPGLTRCPSGCDLWQMLALRH
ncbi:MAG: hypothetical protein JWQ73_4145 [Variovorax sp.]|nr:hypothetical protein [Variovorax sp.]